VDCSLWKYEIVKERTKRVIVRYHHCLAFLVYRPHGLELPVAELAVTLTNIVRCRRIPSNQVFDFRQLLVGVHPPQCTFVIHEFSQHDPKPTMIRFLNQRVKTQEFGSARQTFKWYFVRLFAKTICPELAYLDLKRSNGISDHVDLVWLRAISRPVVRMFSIRNTPCRGGCFEPNERFFAPLRVERRIQAAVAIDGSTMLRRLGFRDLTHEPHFRRSKAIPLFLRQGTDDSKVIRKLRSKIRNVNVLRELRWGQPEAGSEFEESCELTESTCVRGFQCSGSEIDHYFWQAVDPSCFQCNS